MSKYVITEDLEFLMQQWVNDSDFRIPDCNFFQNIQNRLSEFLESVFPNVLLIKQNILYNQLRNIMESIKNVNIVTIDRMFDSAQFYLESNRIADISTQEIIGEAQRPGHQPLEEQILLLPKDRPIVLVDDGCFSGETLFRIVRRLKSHSFVIQNVVVGVLIGRQHNRLLQEYSGLRLSAVYEFDEVIDWICERDFYLGSPLSGRTAGTKENGVVEPCNPGVSLPYCLPFGDPIKGASVPTDRTVEYSRFIIDQSCELWEEVEQRSGKVILCSDISRLPIGIHRDNCRFVEVLSGVRDML